MKLYTINGTYPDTNFHFTVTCETLGASPSIHQHVITNIASLQNTLDAIPIATTAIVIGGTVFSRNEDEDDKVNGLYAWTNANTTYKTPTEVPTSSTNIYSSEGNLISGTTVSTYVVGHTHTCLAYFIGNDDEKVYGDVVLSSDNATLTIASGTVNISYTSPRTGTVAGILDNNNNDSIGIFQFYHGDIRDLPEGMDTNILTI